ncbi:unnamed protein product [Polarella glacialis]|uniref:Uncharacterized protein n=1 Tax=Polarella glacialis TaxID=89957 RepID=A0A813JPN9_POLGL|nr:unnamed protein product [Polarella glacialis]
MTSYAAQKIGKEGVDASQEGSMLLPMLGLYVSPSKQLDACICIYIWISAVCLLLEIHELRDWDLHQKGLLLQRQAECLAKALHHHGALKRLRASMAPQTLELLALQALVAGNKKSPKLDVPGLDWSLETEHELLRVLERRSARRRSFLHQQRQFLMQDLGMR